MKNKEYKKYPSMPYLESNLEILKDDVKVFEKLDGGNCQIRKINNRIIPGSRSNFLEGKIVENVWWFQDFVSWAKTNHQFYNLDEEFILFGEWLAKHNITYDSDKMNKFYFFDMYDLEEGRFLPYETSLEYLEIMGVDLNTVDILTEGVVSKYELKKHLNKKSSYRDGAKEGLVIKNYEKQDFAKMLHPDFSEIREGKNLSNVEKYVTPMRWRKVRDSIREGKGKFSLEDIVYEIQKDVIRGHDVILEKRDIYKRLKEMDLITNHYSN